MKAMADTKTPQGVLAVARQKKYTLEEQSQHLPELPSSHAP